MSLTATMLFVAASALAADVEPDYVQRFRKYVAGLQADSGHEAGATKARTDSLMRVLGTGKIGPPPKGEVTDSGPGWVIVGGTAYFESPQVKNAVMGEMVRAASKAGLQRTLSKREVFVPKYSTIEEPPQGSFGRFDQAPRFQNEGGVTLRIVPRLVTLKELSNDEIVARYELQTFNSANATRPVNVVASPPMLLRGVPANRAGGRVLGVHIFEVSGTAQVQGDGRRKVTVPVLISRDIERYIEDDLQARPAKPRKKS